MSVRNYIFKTCFLILGMLFYAQGSLAAPAAFPPVKVQVDGREITFDAPPVIENGRALVPFRAISEALGARVNWEEKSKTVTMVKENVTVKLVIGNTIALKNTEELALEAPAKIIKSRTMVPLRFVGEALGANVQWDPASRLISISKPAEKSPWRELIVQGDTVNIRSGPATNHDVLLQVSRGVRLPVLDKSADWYKVQMPDGKMGWIVAWYVTEESSSPPVSPPVPEKSEPVISVPGDDPALPVAPSGNGVNEGEKPAGENNEKQAAVVKLTVKQENELTRVEVTSDQELAYNIFRLRDPDRLVMDIHGAAPGDLPSSQTINAKAVSRLRVGWFSQNPDITRLVFDLNEQVLYKAEASADQKSITLDIFVPNIKEALKGRIIVLDPGHGGAEPGAIGKTLGLKEKNVNLEVARRTARLLEGYGASVIFTRSGDYDVNLYARPQQANAVGAGIFVSIHMNSNTSTLLKGTSTYYMRSDTNKDERLAKSRQLAEHIQNALLAILQLEDKGTRQDDFVVLRETTMPAVLIEVAFISNPEEERLMTTEQFLENAAQAIVQGIGSYMVSAYSN